MKAKSRRSRSQDDILAQLETQLFMLSRDCREYDSGLTIFAKSIAVRLRILLHESKNSHALLKQVGLINQDFLDTAGDINARNIAGEVNLCVVQMSLDGSVPAVRYLPICLCGASPRPERWIRFDLWWNAAVISDGQGQEFSRKTLIGEVANTDGGAHVDSELNDDYMALSRENLLGFFYSDTQGNSGPLNDPTLPSLRQIAHEVFKTLKQTTAATMISNYSP